MDLEKRIQYKEGADPSETAIDLGIAGLAVVGAYNLAGWICNGFISNNMELSDHAEESLTIGLLTLGAIGGYKLRTGINKLRKKANKKISRESARARTLAELSEDDEFLERQNIRKGSFGKIRKALKYLITVPAGGALGWIPGTIGTSALCVYFGRDYSWSTDASLGSGQIAIPLISAYSFAEMTAKKQYKRLVTTASALAGGIAGVYIEESNASSFNILENETDLWKAIGSYAVGAAVFGIIGNQIYKGISKIVKHYKDKKKLKALKPE